MSRMMVVKATSYVRGNRVLREFCSRAEFCMLLIILIIQNLIDFDIFPLI